MTKTNINIIMDNDTKEQAEIVFNELGLNMTTAVNMFLKAVIRENGIPFRVQLNVPNETTAAAIEEGRKLAADPSARRYTDMDDLKAALEA